MEDDWVSVVSSAELDEMESTVVLVDEIPLISIGDLQDCFQGVLGCRDRVRLAMDWWNSLPLLVMSAWQLLAALGSDKTVKQQCQGFLCSIVRQWKGKRTPPARSTQLTCGGCESARGCIHCKDRLELSVRDF
eukprot:g39071.t1